MSLINDMLNDLEQRKSREDRPDVDLSWFMTDELKPNLVEKPQFWVFGILLTAVAVSVFLHFAEPVSGNRQLPVEVPEATALLMERPPASLPEAAVAGSDDVVVKMSAGTERPVAVTPPARPEERIVAVAPAPVEKAVAPQPKANHTRVVEVADQEPEPVVIEASEVPAEPASRPLKKSLPLSAAQLDQKSFLAAQALVRKGDKLAAEEELRRRLQEDPRALKSAELLASLLLAQERHRAVEALYQSLSMQDVDSADLRTVMGRSYLVRGEPDKALDLLSRKQADVFLYPGYHEVLALAAQRSQRYDLSSKTYQKLLQTNPKRADWWIGLAIGFDQRGNYNAARVAYGRALRLQSLSTPLEKYAQERMSDLVEMGQLLAKD